MGPKCALISRFIFASAEHQDLADEIAATGCDGVIAGHCGIPFVRQVGPGVWINAGAMGMPAGDGTPRIWFAVLTPEAAGLPGRHALDGRPDGHAFSCRLSFWLKRSNSESALRETQFPCLRGLDRLFR
jgi:hypothetical protein